MSTAPRLLIAAGPTHEPIDGVRYIANRSSGRMGIALVEAALGRGLGVTFLLGPTPLVPFEPQADAPDAPRPTPHSQPDTRRFQTADDLRRLLGELWPTHDVLIMAAAVADYRPAHAPDLEGKRPRGAGPWHLELEPTPDLLKELAAVTRPDQTVIGFALEPPDRLAERAAGKLADKRLDAIVANPLETMGAREITATVLLSNGRTLMPPQSPCSKREFADWLIAQLPTVIAGKTEAEET